jgi:hypothetical protein
MSVGSGVSPRLHGVTIVRTAEQANSAVAALASLRGSDTVVAVDTEVMSIDVTEQSPVGNGRVTCVSVFVGGVDFGAGPRLWIDNLGDAEGTLQLFKPFLEAQDVKKVCVSGPCGANLACGGGVWRRRRVLRERQLLPRLHICRAASPCTILRWCRLHSPHILPLGSACPMALSLSLSLSSLSQVYHNYGFDRHVLFNHGIDARGFAGDTMHMARLWSASRAKGGYSLETLTDELLQRRCVLCPPLTAASHPTTRLRARTSSVPFPSLSLSLSLSLSVSLSLYLSIYLSIYLSMPFPPLSISIYLSICISLTSRTLTLTPFQGARCPSLAHESSLSPPCPTISHTLSRLSLGSWLGTLLMRICDALGCRAALAARYR